MNRLARLVVNAVALLVTVTVVPNLKWANEGDLVNIGLMALIFGVINTYLKPILKLFSLPLRMMTFGLFGLVVNTALFLLLAWAGDQVGIGFSVAGWPSGAFSLDVLVAAFLGAIVLSIVSTLLAVIIRD